MNDPIKMILHKLFETYFDHFCPPLWILDFKFDKTLLEKVTCYYDDSSSHSEAEKLLTFREPTNIEMNQLYYKDKLQQNFGYSQSVYHSNSPNIAVYCYSPCKLSIHSNIKYIHVINVIGVALDNRNQIDYKLLKKLQDKYIRSMVYKSKISNVFKKILQCIQDENAIQNIVLHGFGLGVFSSLAPELEINPISVFNECLMDFLIQLSDIKQDLSFKVTLNFIQKLPFDIRQFKNLSIQHIRTPIDQLLSSYSTSNLKSTLFVNAWDPFSMVGNGNAGDNSLDGYFGRLTAMSVLCWPLFNKYIMYKSVSV